MGVQINGSEGNVIATKGTFSGDVGIGGTLTYEDVTNIDSVGLITARSGIEIGARPGVAASISVDGNMIVSGISTFGGDIKTSGSNIILGDSGGSSDDRLLFGAGSDLELYHDGTNSIIHNKTGQTWVQGSELYLSSNHADGQEKYLKGVANGAVELYHNNTKRFETTSSGIKVTQVYLEDSTNSNDNAILLGTGLDLRLYHDGNNAVIQNDTGAVILQNSSSNSSSIFIKAKAGEHSIIANHDGGVELYHDNTKQCETSANGLAFPAGKGIDFSAQTASSVSGVTVGSELFDHYEEGDWTPTLTSGETCSIYAASYTRIGRQVTAYCFLYNFSDFNGNSNSFNITGLPFSKDTSNGNYYAGGYVGYVHNMNYGHPLLPLVSGTPAIYFHRQDGTTNTWKYQDFHNVGNGSGGMLIIQVVYHTAS